MQEPGMQLQATAAETETATPLKSKKANTAPFSWRRLSLILGGSFLLGLVIAWTAIAVGAHIVGVWPHGFALYAMLGGGGMTMLLTSALMGAVFYSDSSGYDEEVQWLQPQRRNPTDMREGSRPDDRDGQASSD